MWKLALYFIFCLALSLLVHMPVSLALPYLHLHPALRLAGADGSLHRGEIARADIEALSLGRLEYRLQPGCLVSLTLCYRFEGASGGASYRYEILSADAGIDNTALEFPAGELARLLGQLPVRPTGRLRLEIDELALVNGFPESLRARLTWRELGIGGGGEALELGDYHAVIRGDGRLYQVDFGDDGGQLALDGDARLLPSGEYELRLGINAGGSVDSRVDTLLGLVAKKSGHNRYRIDRRGRLPAANLEGLFRPPT